MKSQNQKVTKFVAFQINPASDKIIRYNWKVDARGKCFVSNRARFCEPSKVVFSILVTKKFLLVSMKIWDDLKFQLIFSIILFHVNLWGQCATKARVSNDTTNPVSIKDVIFNVCVWIKSIFTRFWRIWVPRCFQTKWEDVQTMVWAPKLCLG